jgi:hypothetical protein
VLSLLPSFRDILLGLTPSELEHPERVDRLEISRDSNARTDVRMAYAPFDHVNASAKLAIVGITPGRQQASNALKVAQRALRTGSTFAEAATEAKVFASFSGPMRANLVDLLDAAGIARWLGIDSTASLWNDRTDLVHFTSAIRYPVFVEGRDWNGSNPNALKSEEMQRWLLQYTGKELGSLPGALIVPLGGKVAEMLHYLAASGAIQRDQILAGLPHPSGANAERIAYFLGRKPRQLLSAKTNADALDTARDAVKARVRAFG